MKTTAFVAVFLFVQSLTGSAAAPHSLALQAPAAPSPEEKAGADKAAQEIKALAWSKCLKIKDKFVNSSGITLMFIPAGSFVMGSPSSPREYGRSLDETQHPVTLTRSFLMSRTEITQKDYAAIMGFNPSPMKGDKLPASNMTWFDAEKFCVQLTTKERAAGKLPAEWGYRLPTEAEWEYACRAGSTGAFAGTGDLKTMGWYKDNSGGKIHPVAGKQSNAWGLFDMHGNVGEYCLDNSPERPADYAPEAVTDPRGPLSNNEKRPIRDRAVRGGDIQAMPQLCRSANRRAQEMGSNRATDPYPLIGLRIVCAPVMKYEAPASKP